MSQDNQEMPKGEVGCCDLVRRLRCHIRAMTPHQRNREQCALLIEASETIERMSLRERFRNRLPKWEAEKQFRDGIKDTFGTLNAPLTGGAATTVQGDKSL